MVLSPLSLDPFSSDGYTEYKADVDGEMITTMKMRAGWLMVINKPL